MEKEVETIEVILYKVTRGKVKSHILPVLVIMVSTITTPSTLGSSQLAARSHLSSVSQPSSASTLHPRSSTLHNLSLSQTLTTTPQLSQRTCQ